MKITIEMELPDGGRAGVLELARRLTLLVAKVLRGKNVQPCLIKDEAGNAIVDMIVGYEFGPDWIAEPSGWALRDKSKDEGEEPEKGESWVIPLPVWKG